MDLSHDELRRTQNAFKDGKNYTPQTSFVVNQEKLDKEIREVEECIRRAVRRDMFEVDVRTAVRPQDIRRAIAEEKPQIVHFCGHGLQDGSLLLEDDGGQNKAVAPAGLASLFELHANYVNCVLLNACHSAKSAEAISEYINYTIGMNQEIQDKSAIQFAQGFYDGLGYTTPENQDVFQRAFQEGLVAIKLENLSQAEIPVIKTRINIDKPHKPMDIALLVKFLAPCLPFLLNVGNNAVEGAAKKLGEDVWRKATDIWGKLLPKVEAKPMAKGAAEELANSPDDADALDILQKQLKKLLDEDKALAADIAGLMQEDSEVISKFVNTFNQTVTGNDNVVQNVTGKVGGDNVGGDKNTIGNISGGTGIAIGRQASATVNTTNRLQNANNPEAQKLADLLKQLQVEIEKEDSGMIPKDQNKALTHLETIGKFGGDRQNSDLRGQAETALDALPTILSQGTGLNKTHIDTLLTSIKENLGL
jgi:hypothetical protein